jgi:non-heme chloroperoxidase
MTAEVQHNAAVSPVAPGIVVRTTSLATGVTLPFVERGDPQGIPVVFVHGITDSWRSWEPVLPLLPESIHAFALTQRGHGDADKPEVGYTFEVLADDDRLLETNRAVERRKVVGHSVGSCVAQRLAMDHPELVRALVLIGSVTTWKENAVVAGLWESDFASLTDPIDPTFVREFQRSPWLAPGRLEIAVAESLKAPARVWRQLWRAMMETDWSAALAHITAPTLILWGDEDPLCPRSEQDALLAAIGESRLVVLPDRGHNLHWEEPELVAREIASFVEGFHQLSR